LASVTAATKEEDGRMRIALLPDNAESEFAMGSMTTNAVPKLTLYGILARIDGVGFCPV
jgi:hypothetical protein